MLLNQEPKDGDFVRYVDALLSVNASHAQGKRAPAPRSVAAPPAAITHGSKPATDASPLQIEGLPSNLPDWSPQQLKLLARLVLLCVVGAILLVNGLAQLAQGMDEDNLVPAAVLLITMAVIAYKAWQTWRQLRDARST
jgi:hypothetical protein